MQKRKRRKTRAAKREWPRNCGGGVKQWIGGKVKEREWEKIEFLEIIFIKYDGSNENQNDFFILGWIGNM